MATESKKVAGGHTGPAFADDIRRQVRELSRLEPNWDGYGAPIIKREIIEAVCSFVGRLPVELTTPPHVVPMSGGNLQLEWHRGSRVLELEFETTQTVRFLQWDPQTNTEDESEFPLSDVGSAVELIHWFESGARE